MPDGALSCETVISSVIVQARDSDADRIASAIGPLPGVEIHSQSQGKLIVVIETATDGQLAERVSDISAVPGVLGVNLVFHHTEPA